MLTRLSTVTARRMPWSRRQIPCGAMPRWAIADIQGTQRIYAELW
ncbi:Uncharacterised protein [Edwardsiella tarda]|nr:Uncharacterised protein [Edwardsiella tarda]